MLAAVRPLWVPQWPFCEPLHVARPGTVDFCRFIMQWLSKMQNKFIHLEGDIFPVEDRPEGIYFRPKVFCLFCISRSLVLWQRITYFFKVIYNSLTAEYVLWINYLAPALSPLVSYPDVSIFRECCRLYVVVWISPESSSEVPRDQLNAANPRRDSLLPHHPHQRDRSLLWHLRQRLRLVNFYRTRVRSSLTNSLFNWLTLI